MADGQDFVGLAEVVRQIRGELEKARDEAEGRALGFTVERVNLEFTVQVHRAASGRGGAGCASAWSRPNWAARWTARRPIRCRWSWSRSTRAAGSASPAARHRHALPPADRPPSTAGPGGQAAP